MIGVISATMSVRVVTLLHSKRHARMNYQTSETIGLAMVAIFGRALGVVNAQYFYWKQGITTTRFQKKVKLLECLNEEVA